MQKLILYQILLDFSNQLYLHCRSTVLNRRMSKETNSTFALLSLLVLCIIELSYIHSDSISSFISDSSNHPNIDQPLK